MLCILLCLLFQVFMFLYVTRYKFLDFRRVYFSVLTVADLKKDNSVNNITTYEKLSPSELFS